MKTVDSTSGSVRQLKLGGADLGSAFGLARVYAEAELGHGAFQELSLVAG